jgi:AcrR family transcriptional regulator
MPNAGRNADARPPASSPPEKLRSGATYPPGYVAAHQRRRLLAATGPALIEHGYARLTTRKVADAARVSSASFYAHFENLDDCLLAAHGAAAEGLYSAIGGLGPEGEPSAGAASEPAWPCRVAATVEAALGLAAEHPGQTALLVYHFPSAERRLNGSLFVTIERLAQLLHEHRDPDAADPPPELARGMVGASLSLLAARLFRGEPIEPGELSPLITQMLLTPYLGPERAADSASLG